MSLTRFFHILYLIDYYVFKFHVKAHLYVVWGLIAALTFYFQYDVSLMGSILFGLIVSVVLLAYFSFGQHVSLKGLKLTDATVNSFTEISNDESTTVKTVQLASLVNKNYSKEEIIDKSNEWGISNSSIKIAILYQKHPVLSFLATIVFVSIITAIIYAVLQLF